MTTRGSQRHLGPLLDAYLDGELGRRKRREVERHLRLCASCRTLLEATVALRRRMQSLPLLSCPEEVVARVQAVTAPRPVARRHVVLRPGLVWRLALAGATVAVALLLVLRQPWQRPTPEETTYSAEQVAQARRDAERALAYVSYALRLTQQTLEQEVLPGQVVKPLKRGVSAAFDIFTESGGRP